MFAFFERVRRPPRGSLFNGVRDDESEHRPLQEPCQRRHEKLQVLLINSLSLHNVAPLTSSGALRLGLRSALNDSHVTI